MIWLIWYLLVAFFAASFGCEIVARQPESPVGGVFIGIALLCAYWAGGMRERLNL